MYELLNKIFCSWFDFDFDFHPMLRMQDNKEDGNGKDGHADSGGASCG